MKTPFLKLSHIALLLITASFLAACSKGSPGPANTGSNVTTTTNTTTTTDAYAVSTFAGSGNYAQTDGTGINASFGSITSMEPDTLGNLYVYDRLINKGSIRKITSTGVVSTILNNLSGSLISTAMTADANGNVYLAFGGLYKITPTGTLTSFIPPYQYSVVGICADRAGNLYSSNSVVGDQGISKLDFTKGTITPFVGNGIAGNADGTGSNASFTALLWMKTDHAGNLYDIDRGASSIIIRKITPAGVVTTITPSISITYTDFLNLAIDGSGNIYVTDQKKNEIFKIAPNGVAGIFAGTGVAGKANGGISQATFNGPSDIVVNDAGTVLYVMDTQNYLIRKIVKN